MERGAPSGERGDPALLLAASPRLFDSAPRRRFAASPRRLSTAMKRWLRPSRLAARVWEVEVEELWREGVRGVILDLDNTLVDWNRTELRPEVRAWVATAQERGLRLCLVSNAFRGKRVQVVARELGLPALVRAGKPFARAFRRGMAQLGTRAEETCAIGDQVFTDMLGANRLGLLTVLLAPLSARESPHTRVIRWVEGPLRRRWASAARPRGGKRP